MDSQRWASTLVDEAIIAAMMPWACPCNFGPEGRFRLEELVYLGKRSLVYRGIDKRLSSSGFAATVAIKITSTQDSGVIDALSARRIVHPNVVRVLDLGIDPDSGASFIVTEFIEGGDMSHLQVPVESTRAAALIAQLARGVQAAHAAGVVHCDLKPTNVLMTSTGMPKLADFDLCRSPVNPDCVVRGNRAFMAPEQALGGDAGLAPLADIYALGGMLRWLLTGIIEPGTPDSLKTELALHADYDLSRICLRALETERNKRHSSAGELADDLERWLTSRPIEWTNPNPAKRAKLWVRRNPGRASILSAVAIVLTSVGVLEQRHVAFKREQEAAEQAKALSIANKEIESLKGKTRSTLRAIILSSGLASDRSENQLFPQLVMWSMFTQSDLLDQDTKAYTTTHRMAILRDFLRARENTPSSNALVTTFARIALAQYLLDEGQSEAALGHLALARAWCQGHLSKDDAMLSGLNVLEAAAAFDQAVMSHGSDAPALLGSLRDSLAKARLSDENNAACAVADRVLLRNIHAPLPAGPRPE